MAAGRCVRLPPLLLLLLPLLLRLQVVVVGHAGVAGGDNTTVYERILGFK